MEKKREKERERENSTFTERYEKENVFKCLFMFFTWIIHPSLVTRVVNDNAWMW